MKITTIQFERQMGIPLYKQIYSKIKHDILHGYIKKGDQLPSIRKCEILMKVSKTSIEKAYALLHDEGLIRADAKVGYFVDVDQEHAQMRKMIKAHTTLRAIPKARYDFRSQTMDVDAFDIALWKKYLKGVLDQIDDIATYGDPQGEYNLRQALQQYAYSMRGVLCDCEQIVVGSSFQTLFYILCGLFDTLPVIGMEESGFAQAENVCSDYGLHVVKFKSDENGIPMDALYQSKVDVLYVNSGSYGSEHQAITRKQADALMQWAKLRNTYILEDDHNGELRYQTKVMPAMQGYASDDRVIYAGSFSKLLLPSLRISYMVLPHTFAHAFQNRIACYAPTSSKIEQLALAHYIIDGHLHRHVKRLRKRYERKSMRLLNALHTSFPQATFHLEESALQIVVHFQESFDVTRFCKIAKKDHIYIQYNQEKHIVLSFAGIDEEEIESAVTNLLQIYTNMKKVV